MMTRQRCVLLDAVVVIHLHRLGVWGDFIAKYEVILPETVVDEAAFHSVDDVTGDRVAIDLSADLDAGRILVMGASQQELQALVARLPRWLIIDPGETEAIALLSTNSDLEDCLFCTADQAAVKAATMVGLAEQCESLEQLLARSGMTKVLPHHFTIEVLKQWIAKAQQEKINWT